MSLINKYNDLAYYTLSMQDAYFTHQHVVDAFAAQTATEDTKPITITFALVGLHLFIEKDYTGKEVQKFHTWMSNNKMDWPVFILPHNKGEITIDHVLEATTIETRKDRIKQWCTSIWSAFNKNHTAIQQVADYYIHLKQDANR